MYDLLLVLAIFGFYNLALRSAEKRESRMRKAKAKFRKFSDTTVWSSNWTPVAVLANLIWLMDYQNTFSYFGLKLVGQTYEFLAIEN